MTDLSQKRGWRLFPEKCGRVLLIFELHQWPWPACRGDRCYCGKRVA